MTDNKGIKQERETLELPGELKHREEEISLSWSPHLSSTTLQRSQVEVMILLNLKRLSKIRSCHGGNNTNVHLLFSGGPHEKLCTRKQNENESFICQSEDFIQKISRKFMQKETSRKFMQI